MAQRITRLTTDQKIAGSNPAGIDTFFLFLVLSFFSAPPFYPHCKPDTALAKEIDAKDAAPPGGLEPPTFRLTAERASHCATEAYTKPKICKKFSLANTFRR